MHGQAWISLFHRIPANLHDGLMLTLTTGAEVVVQAFVQLDTDYAIVRGRMAGAQDNGRVMMIPYSNLVAVNITRRMTEPEIAAVFGQHAQPFAAGPAAAGAAEANCNAAT